MLRRPTYRMRFKAGLGEVGKLERASDRVLSLAGYVPGWTPSSSTLGTPKPPTRPTSPPHARCWTLTTTALTMSKSGSWNTWRFAPAARSGDWRSSAVVVRRGDRAGRSAQVWAEHRLGESVARALGASSCASPLVGYAIKPRSVVTGAPPSRSARPDRPGDYRSRIDQSGRPARRNRQGRFRLSRRSSCCLAGGPRSRADPHLPRPLP